MENSRQGMKAVGVLFWDPARSPTSLQGCLFFYSWTHFFPLKKSILKKENKNSMPLFLMLFDFRIISVFYFLQKKFCGLRISVGNWDHEKRSWDSHTWLLWDTGSSSSAKKTITCTRKLKAAKSPTHSLQSVPQSWTWVSIGSRHTSASLA